MLAVFAILGLLCIESAWDEIQGPLRDFLDADGNTAVDYLENGANWYQMKVKLHGTYYYIPFCILSEKTYYAQQLKESPRYRWTLTLPFNDIQTEENKQRRSNQELTQIYGSLDKIITATSRSCMCIQLQDGQYTATIDWVNSNKYYSGKEVMAIFMTIAVKKNIKFARIGLTDTSTKICHKLLGSLYEFSFVLLT